MLDFQRKKDSTILTSGAQRDTSFLFMDQSKNLYDYILKHDSQMKQIESELRDLKYQIKELTTSNSFLLNNDLIINIKEEIKNDLIKDINSAIYLQKNELKTQIENLKEETNEIINENEDKKNKFLEINNYLENLNKQLILSNEEKTNLENDIFNKVENDKKELSQNISNLEQKMDNFDLDFDRLIQSLKVQFLNSSNTINQLENSKVNIADYEKEIEAINQNIEELNNKIESISQNNLIDNKSITKNVLSTENDENSNECKIDKKLNIFKEELYNELENINLKILNELKNQADDIKIIYHEINNINKSLKQTIYSDNSENNLLNKMEPNLEDIEMKSQPKNKRQKKSTIDNTIYNNFSLMDELSKKADIEQLNFALDTQAKLNEAFSSASRISRFCWDSEGGLNDNKYIKWTIQNINTALDVFNWDSNNNSDGITILKNGVYKIVIGLIGLERNKNFGIVINNLNEDIIINNNHLDNGNDNDINNDKGNVKFMERYIACEKDTKIKVALFDSTDNSEEAFLELTKII